MGAGSMSEVAVNPDGSPENDPLFHLAECDVRAGCERIDVVAAVPDAIPLMGRAGPSCRTRCTCGGTSGTCSGTGWCPRRPAPSGRLAQPQARAVNAELGQVVNSQAFARDSDDEVVVANPFGLFMKDIPVATRLHRAAVPAGLGRRLGR